MSKTKKMIISIYALALCILVSFAWINELQNPAGRVMALRLNDAAIGDSEIKVHVTALNDEEDPEDDITWDDAAQDLKAFDNFAPSERRKFRVDIKNNGKAPVRLSMILTDIICENEELQENIIIGTNGFEGFNNNYPAPAVRAELLSESMDDTGSMTLIDIVEIPKHDPENENDFVSIYFYVMFSSTGRETLEDQTFTIGTINFLTL